MPIDWKSAYAAALREQDPAKLSGLCDQAREKINARILELASAHVHTEEREKLDEALRELVLYELKQIKPPTV